MPGNIEKRNCDFVACDSKSVAVAFHRTFLSDCLTRWYNAVWLLHGWCRMKLLLSRCALCRLHHKTINHVMSFNSCNVHACLSVTGHRHFSRNDRALLRAAAVTRVWNGYRNNGRFHVSLHLLLSYLLTILLLLSYVQHTSLMISFNNPFNTFIYIYR